jgi:hypothetical protein
VLIIEVCVVGLIADALLLGEAQVGFPPLLPSLFMGSIAVILLLWRLPVWQVARSKGLADDNKFNRENEARKTVAQILAGFFVLVSLYSSVQTLNLSREGQITDRFTKAIEQLGAVDGKSNPRLEVRLGGIYALERISRDSERDYSVVMEILATYIREYSPVIKQDSQKVSNQHQPYTLRHPNVDIQAILTVLGRREIKYFLVNLDLRRANLGGADLSRTKGLITSNLSGSNLSGADLNEADLSVANLRDSNLSGASLKLANLQAADFFNANLTAADLDGADLRFAHLNGADLGGADLTGANLGNADLRGAVITQKQVDVSRGDAQTQLPTGLRMPDHWPK